MSSMRSQFEFIFHKVVALVALTPTISTAPCASFNPNIIWHQTWKARFEGAIEINGLHPPDHLRRHGRCMFYGTFFSRWRLQKLPSNFTLISLGLARSVEDHSTPFEPPRKWSSKCHWLGGTSSSFCIHRSNAHLFLGHSQRRVPLPIRESRVLHCCLCLRQSIYDLIISQIINEFDDFGRHSLDRANK